MTVQENQLFFQVHQTLPKIWSKENVHFVDEEGINVTKLFRNTGTMEGFKPFADANSDRQRLLPQRGGRQGLPPQYGGRQRLLYQHRGQPDAAYDTSPTTTVNKGRQGLLPQHGDHKVPNLIEINKHFVPVDVSPHMAPAGNDGRVRGPLYAQADIPGPEEERGRTSGSLPNEADVPTPEEEQGRNDDPLRIAEMGSPCHSSGCQKTRSKGLEEMTGEKEKRENSHATM